MANSRARLRMTALYAVGQANQLLVTGTGNKIEDFGIGFFTKYGDGGVDLNPIGDLLKSEVFQLANHLGVIEEILKAKPTDGLWGDRKSTRLNSSHVRISYADFCLKKKKKINKLY